LAPRWELWRTRSIDNCMCQSAMCSRSHANNLGIRGTIGINTRTSCKKESVVAELSPHRVERLTERWCNKFLRSCCSQRCASMQVCTQSLPVKTVPAFPPKRTFTVAPISSHTAWWTVSECRRVDCSEHRMTWCQGRILQPELSLSVNAAAFALLFDMAHQCHPRIIRAAQ